MNAETEDSSATVPLWFSFSFDEATFAPFPSAGAELEFPTVAAYNVQSMVSYGKIFSI